MARRTRTPRTQKRRIHHLGITPRPIRHPKCRTTLLQNQLPPFPRCRHEGVPCQYRHRTQRTTTPLHQSTRHGSPELGTATRTLKNIHIKGFIMKRFTAAALSIVLSVGVSAGVAQAQDFSDPATTPGKITAHPKKQSLLQPPVEATIYAEPYGIVPDHHAAANFSPLGTRKSAKIRGSLHQPLRYSLFFNSFEECQADFDPYAHDFSVMNAIIPPHWIWMAKNDWTQQISTQCYQIYNGKWVYEYDNFFEMPVVPNPQKLPGRYPKDVPPEQQKYLRK